MRPSLLVQGDLIQTGTTGSRPKKTFTRVGQTTISVRQHHVR